MILPLAALLAVTTSCDRSANASNRERVISEVAPVAAQRCATLAAHPSDRKRIAEGVADQAIISALAVPACQEALTADSGNQQLQFQLARALHAAGRAQEALALLGQASSYCGAGYYKAQAEIARYWQDPTSWSPIKIAIGYLEPESDCFAPSGELLPTIKFRADDFPAPKLVDALWQGRVDVLNQNRFMVARVLNGLQNQLSEMVATFDAGCPARLVTQDVSQGLAAALSGDPRSTLEGLSYRALLIGAEWFGKAGDTAFHGDPERWSEYLEQIGRRTANRLSYHSCLSPAAIEIYRGVQLFASTPRPLAEYLADLTSGKGLDLIPLPTIAPLVARQPATQP